MRNNGYCFFDLGGIDKNSNPGVAKFKIGIGGDEVTFIGDWISFNLKLVIIKVNVFNLF